MARTNIPLARRKTAPKTHEGAPAKIISNDQALRRSVMSCMLWEDTFYEDGQSIAERIANLVPNVLPEKVAAMAITARQDMNLRHCPLWIVKAMAQTNTHKPLVKDTLAAIIQRPDELTEFLSLYWKDGKTPISAQVKKGLAKAFTKFDAYQLAKYNRDGAVKLRDVLFLCHPKPKDKEQQAVWDQLVNGTLPAPDTWEVGLSSGADKLATWTRLIKENKLGALALLRNLRNMEGVGVEQKLIVDALSTMKVDRVLPFRFIAAERYAPHLAEYIEMAFLRSIKDKPKIPGLTVLLIDVSGSMDASLSQKSEMTRWHAACGLAILCRELCEQVKIFDFAGDTKPVPNRRGFALRDVIRTPHNGTMLGDAIRAMPNADRLICITDEQSHQRVPDSKCKGYMVNVASYQNGVGYGRWTHIDGWSEAVLDFINAVENNL